MLIFKPTQTHPVILCKRVLKGKFFQQFIYIWYIMFNLVHRIYIFILGPFPLLKELNLLRTRRKEVVEASM